MELEKDNINTETEKTVSQSPIEESPATGEVILPSPKKKKTKVTDEKTKGASSLYDIAEMFACCAAVILLIFTFCARLTVVEGPSMEKTLHKDDYLLVRSIGYEPKRGDIVVIHDPTAGSYDHPLVKRLIAVGGDTVDINFDTWTVTVNGEVLDESEYLYIDPNDKITSDYKFPIQIKDGCVFVMGDNRHHSADSRTSAIGQIDERCIVGKAMVRVLPFDRIRVFD